MSGGGGDQAGVGDQGPGPGFDEDEELFLVDMIVVPDNANDQPDTIKNGDILGNQIVIFPILIDKSTGCCESFQCWVACYFKKIGICICMS